MSTVKEILQNYLKENGYDGLYQDGGGEDGCVGSGRRVPGRLRSCIMIILSGRKPRMLFVAL